MPLRPAPSSHYPSGAYIFRPDGPALPVNANLNDTRTGRPVRMQLVRGQLLQEARLVSVAAAPPPPALGYRKRGRDSRVLPGKSI